ncbi:MAG: glutamate synthase subunit beta [Gammaproteobacteria bacterium]|nr:glutamate synthase subunit beta [Gammaproteobacteria bacterium]MCY4283013.1 glutamate synthase subunit beta [Gammaproteobacteria bacterium]MCY4339669.1 glutamate synthase subunit beta [Gammaproteobacteria bacterium]
MGKVTGFIEFERAQQPYRPVPERLADWRQVMAPWPVEPLKTQASRCMDCGIPFCHQGCPLGNLIPDWNDLVYRDQWLEAIQRLHATNNFPEFTGTLCPAPCEGSCVLGINDDPVTIKAVELSIIDKAWENGWVKPEPAAVKTGKRIAVVGSGPAGLAAAQQLARAGHEVTVFERDDRIGGLLRYGIPEFKMEKRALDRRLEQMRQEGVVFRPGCNVGADIDPQELCAEYDAVLLAGGATQSRDLPAAGRELAGIYQAMDYLPLQNKRCEGDDIPDAQFISARDKHVIIIGGGDTGADCLGTANRQGAKSVHQLEIMPKPPNSRAADNPWPEWPRIYRVASAHEEGVKRVYAVSTKRFLDDGQGHVAGLELVEVEMKQENGRLNFVEIPGTDTVLPCDLALLAMGFLGPEQAGMLAQLGVELTPRGNVKRDENWMTSKEGVFTAGDMQRGQSLIVWAIAEGRSAAQSIDRFLMGSSDLPAPLT